MTFQELRELRGISMEIKRIGERVYYYLSKTEGVNNIFSTVGGGSKMSDPVGHYVALSLMESDKLGALYEKRKALDEYISAIPDSITRQIFALYLIDCMDWARIPPHVGDGTMSKEAIWKRYYRYVINCL